MSMKSAYLFISLQDDYLNIYFFMCTDSMNFMKFIIAMYKMILLYMRYCLIIHKGYMHIYIYIIFIYNANYRCSISATC